MDIVQSRYRSANPIDVIICSWYLLPHSHDMIMARYPGRIQSLLTRAHKEIIVAIARSTMSQATKEQSALERYLPILTWLPAYRRDWLRTDIVASYFNSEVQRNIDEAGTPVRQVMIDARAINRMDSTAAEHLNRLKADLDRQGILPSFTGSG